MRTYLFPGLIAPQIIGILLAWQQKMTLNWLHLTLALLLNLIIFVALHSYLIKPDRHYSTNCPSILFVCLASSLFVVSAYVLQSNQLSGAIILASLPIGLYSAVVVYIQQFSTLRTRSQMEILQSAIRKTRLVGASLISLVTLTILLDCFLDIYPWYAGIAILTTFPLLIALHQIDQDLQLRISATGAYWQTILLFSIALLIHGFIGI
ncbi:hypothetical protein [Dictyobacter formicarum]|uniref:Prenyltransferase n=1 Tax=Dictyobacter formicarum TaxID=2778368 RepID=A0ABQ3VT12_9CHLR|nr:hypothetical protein [Dictyobacter formicarum]GHO89350.1 hypothetical protein KSZ_73560 [Dictyobacter formicarum]